MLLSRTTNYLVAPKTVELTNHANNFGISASSSENDAESNLDATVNNIQLPEENSVNSSAASVISPNENIEPAPEGFVQFEDIDEEVVERWLLEQESLLSHQDVASQALSHPRDYETIPSSQPKLHDNWDTCRQDGPSSALQERTFSVAADREAAQQNKLPDVDLLSSQEGSQEEASSSARPDLSLSLAATPPDEVCVGDEQLFQRNSGSKQKLSDVKKYEHILLNNKRKLETAPLDIKNMKTKIKKNSLFQ